MGHRDEDLPGREAGVGCGECRNNPVALNGDRILAWQEASEVLI